MTSRTRTEGPIYSRGTSCLVAFNNGVPRYCVPSNNFYSLKSVSDTLTPNYRSRIASGEIINNPCSITHTTSFAGGGFYRAALKSDPDVGSQVEGDGSVTVWASQFGNPMEHFAKSSLVASMTKAQLKALSHIDASPYAFAEDLFEIRSTLRFLRNPIKSIIKLSRQVDRSRRKRGPRTLKNAAKDAYYMSGSLADIWLTNRFALLPLVRSMMDACEVLENGLSATPNPRRNARGSVSDSVSLSDVITPAQFSFNRATTSKVEKRASILYEVTNPVTGMKRELGLRLSDIPETLWAIVPFSFMVDRVVNVSDYIRAFTNLANPNVEILAASIVTKYTDSTSVTVSAEDAPSYNVQLSGDTHFLEEGGYSRAVWDPDIASLRADFDLSGLVKDITSIVDLLSLIRGAAK